MLYVFLVQLIDKSQDGGATLRDSFQLWRKRVRGLFILVRHLPRRLQQVRRTGNHARLVFDALRVAVILTA